MNLYEELIDCLKYRNKTIEDINFIAISKEDEDCCLYEHSFDHDSDNMIKIDIDSFLEVAKNTEYDDGFGGTEIPLSLIIVGDDWWLERHEYDGSEWFEFKKRISEPKETIKIKRIKTCYAFNNYIDFIKGEE